ncbi:MAG: hypothetical protein ABEH78_05395 [Haloferacaceae archaeon]
MRSHAARALGGALGAVGLLLAARPVAGHVEYTSEGGEDVDALAFLVDVLTDPVNVAVLAGGGAAAVAALAHLHVRPAQRDVVAFRRAVTEYSDLLPWLLRLSFGLPLVGAGFTGYLFSPAVPPFLPVVWAPTRLFQISLGFFLPFGLATRFVAAVGLVGYLLSVPFRPELLLAAEYVPGLVAIVLVGSASLRLMARSQNTRGRAARFDPTDRRIPFAPRRPPGPGRSAVPARADADGYW